MTRKLSRTEGNDGKLCLTPNTVDIHSPTPRPFMVTFQNTTGKEKTLLIFRKDKRMRNETGSWHLNIIERWKKNKDNLLTFWRQMISDLEFYTWPSCQSSRIEIFSDTQSQKNLPRMLFFPRNSWESKPRKKHMGDTGNRGCSIEEAKGQRCQEASPAQADHSIPRGNRRL